MSTKRLVVSLLSLALVTCFYYNSNQSKTIVINAMLKSGSTYLTKTLQESLDYEWKNLVSIRNNKTSKNYLVNKNIITRQHWDPSKKNLDYFRKNNFKLVIHLRDPRQTTLAWTHHLNTIDYILEDEEHFYRDANITPKEFSKLSFTKQNDLAIKYFLPRMLTWMQDWLKIKQEEDLKPDGLKILITTYDELIDNELELCHKIRGFYEIPANNFKHKLQLKNAKVNFRNGDPEEWKSSFTELQKKNIAKMIPDDLQLQLQTGFSY